MSVACVLITHLPLKVELLRRADVSGRPTLVVVQDGQRRQVLDCSTEARDVAPGMPLDHALAKCPNAIIVEADPTAYRTAWDRVLDALEQRSPLVEDAGLGLAHVDLKGLELMYGGEANLLRAVANAVPAVYRPRVGVAGGKFPAYIAALNAEPAGAGWAPEDVAAFLAQVSVNLLPTSWEIKARLLGFGIRTLGDLSALPFSAVQAEFGREGARLWRLSLGQDNSPLVPRQHEESISVELALPAPTASLSALTVALEGLVRQAFGKGLRGRYTRVAVLAGRTATGHPWSRRNAFREPLGGWRRAFTVLRDTLAASTLPGPLESLSLTLSGITGESGQQESLFSDVRRREQLGDAVRQLEARLGKWPPIYLVREVEPWSRIPERREALVPYEP